jgi:membrane dipeptidase
MDPKAKALHDRSIVIDGLNISRWHDEEVYRHLHEGGVTAVNATIAVFENARETLAAIGRFYRDFETSRFVRPVTRVADIHAAKRERKVGIIFGTQNTALVEDDLNLVEVFYRLGVRVMQVTYNDLNFAGAGCYEREDVGLSTFGVDLVREMNRVGMVVDLSHVGYRTTMQAIEVSEGPCWFSHANPAALKKHVRNKTDEQARACVAKGGVVGANVFTPFLKREYEATIDDLLDVLDYWVELVGVDHVSIGLDFTENQSKEWFDRLMRGKRRDTPVWPLRWPFSFPKGIERADQMPHVTAGLLGRGYSEEDVQKVMGLNVLRLFERVWKE